MALSYKNDKGTAVGEDERLNPASNARDLYRQEHEAIPGYDRENDGLDDLDFDKEEGSGHDYKSLDKKQPADNSAANDIKDTGAQEQRAGWVNNFGNDKSSDKKQSIDLKATVKKRGATWLVVLLLGGGGFGIGVGLTPELVGVDMVKNYTNDMSDSTAAVQQEFDKVFLTKTKSLNKNDNTAKTDCADSAVKCQLDTISDDEKVNLEKDGFKIGTEPMGNGENAIRSLEMPDGTKIGSAAELKSRLNEPKIASFMSKIYGVATPYVSSFLTKVIAPLGVSKAATLIGDTVDKVKASLKARVGIDPASTTEGGAFKALAEKTKALGETLKHSTAIELACTAYDGGREITAGVEAVQMEKILAFIMPVLVTIDAAVAGNGGDGTAMGTVGTMLTSTDNRKTVNGSPNPAYGLSATDAPAFKAVAYGDIGALAPYAEQYLIGGSGFVKFLRDAVAFVNNITGSPKVTKLACKAAADAGKLSCLAGGLISLAICGALVILTPIVLGPLLVKAIKAIIEAGSHLSLDPSTITGPEVGQLLGVGIGILTMRMSLGNGMKPSSTGDMQKFLADTDYLRQRQVAVAKYDAKSTPFDIYNQYSFLGSLVANLGFTGLSGTSLATNATHLFSMIPSALSGVSTAGAAMFMPIVALTPARLNADNATLKAMNVNADTETGLPRFSVPQEVLNMDPKVNTQWMIDNGHIDKNDKTHAAISDDYKNFVKYCTDARADPIGETSESITSDVDDDWLTGAKCTSNTAEIQEFEAFSLFHTVETDLQNGSKFADTSTAATNGGSGTPTPGSNIGGDDYGNGGCSQFTNCTGQCVDFVLFRLVKHHVLPRAIPLGNGKDVVGTLGSLGFKVDTTPAVNSVMSTSHTSHPDLGHTAMVSAVNADGSIVVEEYNYTNPLHYDQRTVSAAEIQAKQMTFAHTEVAYK